MSSEIAVPPLHTIMAFKLKQNLSFGVEAEAEALMPGRITAFPIRHGKLRSEMLFHVLFTDDCLAFLA